MSASTDLPASATGQPRPGWERLWRHSYRLGLRWLLGAPFHGFRGARVGVNRLLVPLDPWRYYEMGTLADEDFQGRCLDVSSPKLLTSLLAREGRGEWVGIDLFAKEIERWRRVDPSLHLEVQDATRLPYGDASFDRVLSVSVVEHIAGDGDGAALEEMWRVLRPGGLCYLTTNVRRSPQELWRDDKIWGEASVEVAGRVFFERHYSPETLDSRLLQCPWETVHREYAMEIDPAPHDRFVERAPWSYLGGALLRRRCPGNFRVSAHPDLLTNDRHGVVYLKLRKPRREGV